MKLNVIVDRDGTIVGTAPASPKAEGTDAPTAVAVAPGAGRSMHKLDLPKEALHLSAADLARRFRVNLRGGARIVRAREAKPAPPLPASPARRKPK